MRSDAVRNRDRIVAAARARLEVDPAPTLSAIARAAGVGQGTLYRHFPTLDELLLAVHRTDVSALVELVPEVLASLGPPAAMRAWLERLAEYGRIKKGLGDAINSGVHTQLAAEGRAPVIGALEALLAAGRSTGDFRSDVTGSDLLALIGFLWRLDPSAEQSGQTSRLLDVVLAGLKA